MALRNHAGMTPACVPALCVVLTCACAFPAQAQPPAPVVPSPKVEFSTPVQVAERYLKDGRRYNRAIALLTDAAAKSPDATTYRLLGMAYAARYASIGFARHTAEFYEGLHKRWLERKQHREKAEVTRDPDADDVTVPREPDRPITPDDDKPFTLTPEQSKTEMIRLGNQCLSAFDQARAQATSKADEQTLTENARGWSILLLQRMGRGVVTKKMTPLAKPDADKNKTADGKPLEVLEIGEWDAAPSFALCVKNFPKNADYWHSLALARAPRRLMPGLFGDNALDALEASGKKTPIADRAPGDAVETPDAAWRVACTLRPNDWELWCQRALYRMADDPRGAVEAMQDAVRRNPANTVLWYWLAGMRRLASDNENLNVEAILRDVESGNAAPVYAPPAFRLPVPAPLRKAWSLEPVYGYGTDGLMVQLFAPPLLDQLKKDIAGEQEKSALRFTAACLGLSAKMTSGLTPDDLNQQSEEQRQAWVRGLLGGVFGQQAYVWIRRDQAARSSDAKAAFLDRYSALFERLQSREKNLIGGE